MTIKNLLVPVLLLVAAAAGNAQNGIAKTDLTGSWQVKIVSVNDLYHDFDTDSTYFPAKAKSSFKDAEDSAKTVELVSFIFEMMKGTVFTYSSDSVYTEANGNRRPKTGTYSLDEKTGIISTVIKANKQDFSAVLKDGILSLTVLNDEKKMVLHLRKK
jgi:hypothetical protein